MDEKRTMIVVIISGEHKVDKSQLYEIVGTAAQNFGLNQCDCFAFQEPMIPNMLSESIPEYIHHASTLANDLENALLLLDKKEWSSPIERWGKHVEQAREYLKTATKRVLPPKDPEDDN